ncbi:MAG TPA: MarR family winged helix-turn-helix transcriptional regulator [Actinospica sp.]|nr:MarR family winged helix-turn-helix transcriptional regulator [Actinospica sp.]
MDRSARGSSWTFLTNHARILIMIARDPGIRLRDVAAACEVTERTAQGVVADLEAGGYLTHTREGRRNRYLVATGTRFRHIAEADHEIAGLLALINDRSGDAQRLDPDRHRDRDPDNRTAATDAGTDTARRTTGGAGAPSHSAGAS